MRKLMDERLDLVIATPMRIFCWIYEDLYPITRRVDIGVHQASNDLSMRVIGIHEALLSGDFYPLTPEHHDELPEYPINKRITASW